MNDRDTVEKMWERCPQFLGARFGNAVLIPEREWYALKRYFRPMRARLLAAEQRIRELELKLEQQLPSQPQLGR